MFPDNSVILNPLTTVPGRNACEIKMFHQEDAGLNVEIAKLAFAKGIWSYVCKMDSALQKYPTIKHPQSSSASAITLIKMVRISFSNIKCLFIYLWCLVTFLAKGFGSFPCL